MDRMRFRPCLAAGAALALLLHAPAARAQGPSALVLPKYVTGVTIGPAPPDSICPNQPIQVRLSGAFQDPCYSVKDVQVIDLFVGPLPRPAIVRVRVVHDACRQACPALLTPWYALIRIPGVPPGNWSLPLQVQVLERDCAGIETPGDISSGEAPFVVALDCVPSTSDCLLWSWGPMPLAGLCDATIAPDAPVTLTVAIRSPVALAGLQGGFSLSPPGLRIADLAATGPAAGMRLVWNPVADGARFALFAESGAPIPAVGNADPPVPVLNVTVAWPGPGGGAVPAVTRLMPVDLIGVDNDLLKVPECRIIAVGDRFADPTARICAGVDCDVNGDGTTDIRDVVTMVRCILSPGTCPVGTTTRLDCDGNGRIDIDDVICCARALLLGHGPIGPPGTEPAIGLAFGAPARTADGIDVPVRVTGADRIGGGRIVVEYASDRFTAASVDVAGADWLGLCESQSGRAALGLIGVGTAPPAGDVELMLHLTLASGAEPGGDVRVTGAEFTARDGATLVAPPSSPSLSLESRARPSLSPAQPNPFRGTTRFTLALPRDASAEVEVLDAVGRLVAVLHRGPLAAGSYPLTWDGKGPNGIAARSGLYFVRARVAGEDVARKIVFLSGR
jgi:hypothetical protein